jgi:UrcA family protein
MIHFAKAIVAAPLFGALALGATALPAQAQDTRTIEVRYSDLNLSTAEGRQSLQTRVRSAAKNVCGGQPTTSYGPEKIAYTHCFTAAMKSANAQVASLTAPVLASR